MLALVSPSEHEVLVFLVQLVAILSVARMLGLAMARVGQPAVVGELLAGVLLGPSILGRVSPGVFDWVFPDTAEQGAMLYGVAWLGLLLLLAATGLESDLGILARLGRPAVVVTVGSLVVPLVVGFALGLAVPVALLGDDATTVVFAAFLAVALSISSLPVVARVLTEMGMIRRNVGQLTLAVAMSNDVVGWILLGLVAGLASTGEVDLGGLGLNLAWVAVFLAASMLVGQRLIDGLLRAIAVTNGPVTTQAVIVVVFVLALGALTHALHVEAVLGAFIGGLVVGRSRWKDERVIRLVETVAHALFAPVFFATAGLQVDLAVFGDPTVALWSVIIVAVAAVTKFAGAMAGAKLSGLPNREGVALGAGLNARGALEIVIATIGLQLGVLNQSSFGVVVVMAIATSVMTPPLLRAILRGWLGTPEEQERLRQEQLARSRLVLSDRPPLLPSRGGASSILAAQVIELAWPPDIPVTVITATDDGEPDLTAIRNVLAEREVRIVPRAGTDPTAAIEAETARGHGALVMGLPVHAGRGPLSPVIDHQVRTSPVPVVLVRPEQISGRAIPQAFARAIVPVTGTLHGRAAQELAFAISAHIGTELLLTHLDTAPRLPFSFGGYGDRQLQGTAEPLLQAAVDLAESSGARNIRTIAQSADNVASRLLQLALEEEADLVVLGTTRRELEEVSHLGTVASHLLELSPTTLIIVVTPQGWSGWHGEP